MVRSTIILGIDPGCITTGYGIMKKEGRAVSVLDYGALRMNGTKPLTERISTFYDFFVSKIETWQVTVLALETPFLGKNAQNFLKLGYLRGILYLLAHKYNLQLYEFSPSEVKLSLTGFGAADKEQVARMLLRIIPGMAMPKKLDVTDALAVTLCGVWKHPVLR
jgi:crossover junction endodeoxyribonuclease RuvC